MRLSDEAKLLDEYLSSYNRCKHRKKVLEKRREQILLEFQAPLKAKSFNGLPKVKGAISEGSANLSLQLDEIDTRIKEKIEDAKKEYVRLNDILDFFENNDAGRIILEYKYIDSLPWWKMELLEHRSKTVLVYEWRKALYRLLEFSKVKQIVKEYKESW